MKMTREYIVKEGLLEAYLLGALNPTQEQQVFEVLQADPELMKTYKALEESLEKVAFENAKTPPPHVKEEVLQQLEQPAQDKPSARPVIRGLFYKRYFGIAASIALLFMTTSLVLLINLNNANQDLKGALNKQNTLLDSISTMAKNTLQNEQWMDFVNDPKTERRLLVGNKLAPKATVLSYINHEKKSVLISLHELPELKGKDYQMWADVKGEMIDMGVIDTSQKTLAMSYIANAESINITIEKKGGSDHPDVSKLIGSVSL